VNRFLFISTLPLGFAAYGCGPATPVAYGEANSLIVAAPEAIWTDVRDTLLGALEPRIRTVRDERTFNVTHVSPGSPEWRELRRWKRVLVVGTAEDAWVEPVVARGGSPGSLPALMEARDVWARGEQRVIAAVLSPGGGAPEVQALLPALHELLDRRYREYALSRMYASGRNRELEERLAAEAGFALALPQIYRPERLDSAWLFSNVYRADSEIVRVVLVAWRSGIAPLGREGTLRWRQATLAEYENYDQVMSAEEMSGRDLNLPGGSGYEVQGIWQRPIGEWPAAGPFLTRTVSCPAADRTYLLDAWLYAPGRDKYEYMIQLETILDSFRCTASTGTR
jgi:hypothetical protein